MYVLMFSQDYSQDYISDDWKNSLAVLMFTVKQ